MAQQTAYDLKGKIVNLLTVTSEVMHYLNSQTELIDRLNSTSSKANEDIKSKTAEKESLEKAVEALKAKIASETQAHVAKLAQESSLVEGLKAQAQKFREEASMVLESARVKEADLRAKFDEFETKRRAFEAKFEKVKELVA